MTNLEIAEFKQAIKNFVGGSELPVEVKRMALSEILREVEQESRQALMAEIADRDAAKQEVKQDAESIRTDSLGK